MKSVIKLKHPEQPEFIYAKPKLEMARRGISNKYQERLV